MAGFLGTMVVMTPTNPVHSNGAAASGVAHAWSQALASDPLSTDPYIPFEDREGVRVVQPLVAYGTNKPPYLIAHRGGAGIAPENSLSAFAESIELGVRYIETDVRTTSDGKAVIFHDATMDRMTDATGSISEKSWREVRSAVLRGTDEGVPLLEDVLGSFPGARFMVDVKDQRSVRPLADAIIATRSAGRVCVAGAWDGWLREVAHLVGPELGVALGWRSLAMFGMWPSATGRWRMRESESRMVYAHMPWKIGHVPVMADPARRRAIMATARRRNVGVMVWTVDEEHAARVLLDAGVMGVITDYPNKLRRVWQERGLWAASLPSDGARSLDW